MKWENACATMLLKHVHFQQDTLGRQTSLNYLRTKDGKEVDFVLCEDGAPTHLIECKYADYRPAAALARFAGLFPEAQAIQLVRDLRQEEYHRPVSIARGSDWLAELAA